MADGEEQTEEGLVAAGVPAEGGTALQRPDGDLVAWFQQGVEELLQAYEETPPTKMVNTFYGVRTSPLLLIRRMAHELAIHRWDAEQAHRTPAGFDAALAADDAEWHIPSSMGVGPFFGRAAVVKGLTVRFGRVFDIGTAHHDFHKVLADGDTAVVLQRLTAVTTKGVTYENEYVWIYTCRDEKIARLDEHVDTFYVAKTLGMVNP